MIVEVMNINESHATRVAETLIRPQFCNSVKFQNRQAGFGRNAKTPILQRRKY